MPSPIMIISKSVDFHLFLKHILEVEGFAVSLANEDEAAIRHIIDVHPLAAILDCGGEDSKSAELCSRIKTDDAIGSIKVIAIIAQGAEAVYLELINAGADRSFHRPFEPIKLIEYLRQIASESRRPQRGDGISGGGLMLNVSSRRVRKGEELIHLTTIEFNLLKLMMGQPGKVFTRDELIAASWPQNTYVDGRTVDVHIGLLRKAIGADDGASLIHTIRGVGYSFQPEE